MPPIDYRHSATQRAHRLDAYVDHLAREQFGLDKIRDRARIPQWRSYPAPSREIEALREIEKPSYGSAGAVAEVGKTGERLAAAQNEIGRASCRERV